MEKNNDQMPVNDKQESVADLKKETHEKDAVKKGYNEQNPAQPEGAFIPDKEAKDN